LTDFVASATLWLETTFHAEVAVAHNFYAEINLHFVWHTGDNRPILTPPCEAVVYDAIRRKAASFRGVLVRAIGGTEDHVHVAVSIPPTLLISEFVGQLKGYSTWCVNQSSVLAGEHFSWQIGYGVVAFGTRDLKWVVGYIARQKEHHARGTTFARLETSEGSEDTSRGPAVERQPEDDSLSDGT
jgi:putative transposase